MPPDVIQKICKHPPFLLELISGNVIVPDDRLKIHWKPGDIQVLIAVYGNHYTWAQTIQLREFSTLLRKHQYKMSRFEKLMLGIDE